MKVHRTAGGTIYGFKRHALNRMAQRRIKRQDVEHVLENYDISHTDVKGNLCLTGNLIDGRRLRVVVAKDSNPLTIITVITLG